jgi:hypothetical protein
MLNKGPIPHAVHGIIEYIAGVAFVVAPFLFGYHSGTAKAVSIAIGVLILVIAAMSDNPVGLARALPVIAHVALDVVLGVVLIAAPFVLGFSNEGGPTAFFMVLGIAHLLITIGTRFPAKLTPTV